MSLEKVYQCTPRLVKKKSSINDTLRVNQSCFGRGDMNMNCFMQLDGISVAFSVHVLFIFHSVLGFHKDPWHCLTKACSHTSLIVTIQGFPATTVGPTNLI